MGSKLLCNLATIMCPMIPYTTFSFFLSSDWCFFSSLQNRKIFFLKLKTPFILKERLKLDLLINFRNTLQGSHALSSFCVSIRGLGTRLLCSSNMADLKRQCTGYFGRRCWRNRSSDHYRRASTWEGILAYVTASNKFVGGLLRENENAVQSIAKYIVSLIIICNSVSVKRRLRTADCRLRTRGKMQTAD